MGTVGRELPNISEEGSQPPRTGRQDKRVNTQSEKLSAMSETATRPTDVSATLHNSHGATPRGASATSSTDPSNITILNINSSSSSGGPPSARSPRDVFQNNLGSSRSSDRTDVIKSNKIKNTSASASGSSEQFDRISQSKQSVSDFASSLTNALLGNKMDMVDLSDSEFNDSGKSTQFNDLSLRPCSPSDKDESQMTSVSVPLKKTQKKHLPKTPASSLDQTGQSSGIPNHRTPMNLTSLDFSLPISEVYEPEPCEYNILQYLIIYTFSF